MQNILKAILKDSCVITSYSPSDGWNGRGATGSVTAACRFERKDGYVQGENGQQVAYQGQIVLAGETSLLMTDTVTIAGFNFDVVKVEEIKNFAGDVVRRDGFLA
jgi:hypothetical protein